MKKFIKGTFEPDKNVVKRMEEELDKYKVIIALLEQDIADRDKMLEQKVEEVYADFMRDYKCMREELDGVYEELAELKDEQRARAEKIKPLSKRRPLRRWIRRLLGIRPRMWMAQQLDEMHELPTGSAAQFRPATEEGGQKDG